MPQPEYKNQDLMVKRTVKERDHFIVQQSRLTSLSCLVNVPPES